MSTDTRNFLNGLFDHWPITIFLPAILLMIAAFIVTTKVWDRHDESVAETEAPAPAPAAPVATAPVVRAPAGVGAGPRLPVGAAPYTPVPPGGLPVRRAPAGAPGHDPLNSPTDALPVNGSRRPMRPGRP